MSDEIQSPAYEHHSYDRLIQVAAGSITAAASALGVLGVGAGVAISLLRNTPEATLTGVSLAGIAVLVGMGSAFAKSKGVLAHHRRATAALLTLGCLIITWTWLLIGRAYTTVAARSSFEQWAWWWFVACWAVASVGLAIFAWRGKNNLGIRPTMIVAALFTFGSAILGLVVLAATTSRSSGGPAISAALEPTASNQNSLTLSGTVTATGLAMDERYEIVALLHNSESQTGGTVPAYETFVGPGPDGSITYNLKIAIPSDAEYQSVTIFARLSGMQAEPAEPVFPCRSLQQRRPPTDGTACVTLRLLPSV